jgi:DHA2 family multidrug resistance protein
MVSGFLQGIGGALMWVPMSVLSYSTLATGLRNDGAVLQTLLRYLASAAGIAAVQSIIIHASAESHAELAAMVNWQALPGVMREALGTTSAAPVLSTVNAEVTRQATMVAYTATFRDMALLNFAMLPLLLLLRRRSPGRN